MEPTVDRRIRVIVDAGIPYTKKKDRRGRTVYIFENSIEREEDKQLSQALWSILPPEKCLISRPKGSGYHTKELETRAPTTYPYRLFNDDGDRRDLQNLFFLLIPVILLAVMFLFLIWIEISIPAFLGGIVWLFCIWTWQHLWFRGQRTFSVVVNPQRVFWRFVLGVVLGVVWLLPSGVQISLSYILGAFWIFTASNMILMLTVDYDRWLLTQRIDSVGGRLPYEEAVSRLRTIAGQRQLLSESE